MEHVKSSSGKKNLILKTWDRCRSFPGSRGRSLADNNDKKRKTKSQVAPDGCFSVYVGPEKQRFVIKAEYANHALFKMLLEDAEMEYGYNSEGPILLPCDVDFFYKVLAEMDSNYNNNDDQYLRPTSSCGFAYGSCSPFNPIMTTRRPSKKDLLNGFGSYGLLTPSRMIKMN